MSLEYPGVDPRRLLSASLEERLVGWLGRMSGTLLLACVVAVWASLLSWSVSDPSLTHATGGSAGNLLGAIGATVSDLLLQMLGLAAVFALLAPMFWALELTFAGRVMSFRTKAGCFPLSVLILAGAFSALPLAASWPFHHGLGGILGDALFTLGTSVFSMVNSERAVLATGLLSFAAGFATLLYSIGLELDDFGRLLLPERRPRDVVARQRRSRVSGFWERQKAWAAGAPEPLLHRTEPQMYPADDYEPEPVREPTWSRPVDRSPPPAPIASLPDEQAVFARPPEPFAQVRPTTVAHWEKPLDIVPPDDVDFDLDTDAESRAIAQRFAPPGAVPATPPQTPMPGLLGGFALRRAAPQYRRPSLNLLKRASATKPGPEFAQTALRGNARLLQDVLADFGVKGEVRDIKPGPVVTLFEFEPARGTKSARVVGLADDIARSMSAMSVRAAVIPGRNAIGIELPNMRRDSVLLREILEAEIFRSFEAALPLALGKSIGGEPIMADLARMPHLLVAGTTGSGKSVGLNAMVLSLLYRHSPEDCRLLMIDPKMLELSVYNGIPHLLTPVVTDPQKAVAALNWAVAEMEERYKRMAKLAVRSIDVFNNRVRNAKKRGEMISRTVHTGFDRATGEAIYEKEEMDLSPMPYIVIVVDEFADLMIVAGKEIECAVQRLAQMARAAGIHLIMATQRPSVDIITGTIKANFPTRISFKVASKIDSRTILNEQGAEQLLGSGDMLYSAGSGQAVRVHGPFVSDEEVESIAQALREQGEPRYIEGITDGPALAADAAEIERGRADDDLYERAVAVVLRDRKASTSYIQRRLAIGYNRAADLIERMEREGLVGLANNVGKREILAGRARDNADAA